MTHATAKACYSRTNKRPGFHRVSGPTNFSGMTSLSFTKRLKLGSFCFCLTSQDGCTLVIQTLGAKELLYSSPF